MAKAKRKVRSVFYDLYPEDRATEMEMRSVLLIADDAPEITREWVESANLYRGKKLVRRGRPPAEARKVSTMLRRQSLARKL